ncbi:MAG: sugar phosphate isomerase/epimerase family protein [Planctomycetota bacterium]
MKIAASYWMFEGGLEAWLPVADAMKQAKELGFDGIELAVASTGVLTHETTESECRDIVAAARDIGVEIVSAASGEPWTCSPSSDDPAERQRIIEFTKKALQLTRWLGTDAYLFVPGAVEVPFLANGPIIPYQRCYERAHDAVSQLVPTAEELGVTIGIENVWNKFLLSPLEFRDFVDSFQSKAVGAYFDAGNTLLTGYPDDWARILGQRIVRVHVKDFKKSVGTLEGFVDMLEGDLDFEALKGALKEVNYTGWVTAEMIPHQPGRPEKTAKAMKELFT